MPPIYLDYNATTPMDPRVFEAMRPWFLQPSNAGSRTHWYGQQAKQAVDAARAEIANLLAAEPEDIILTSGATESNNLAILGLAEYGERTGRRHILSTAIEHKAVLEPLERMAKRGFEIELAPVTSGGYVEPDEIRRRVRIDTLLVSVMHANNETGVLQPIEEIGAHVVQTDALFHTDAAQTFGKEVESLKRANVDLISMSGHKILGPQGIGSLCIRRRSNQRRRLSAIQFGGGQERGLRPGTMSTALAVGFGKAVALAADEHIGRREQAYRVRSDFLKGLRLIEHHLNGEIERALPNVVNVSFTGVDSEALMMHLRDTVAISNGSACTTSQYAPSHVLAAMGLSESRIESAVRISWGPGVQHVPATVFVDAMQRLRMS